MATLIKTNWQGRETEEVIIPFNGEKFNAGEIEVLCMQERIASVIAPITGDRRTVWIYKRGMSAGLPLNETATAKAGLAPMFGNVLMVDGKEMEDV